MLTYKNDPLLFDKASKPKNYVTVREINENQIFLKKGILNLYSALVKKKDFKRRTDRFNIILRRIPYASGEKITLEFLKFLDKAYSKKDYYLKFREEIAYYCYLKERIPLKQFKNWIERKEIPFVAIRVLAYNFDDELELMSHLFLKCSKISGIYTKGFLPPLTMGECLNPLNVYFIGAAFGDGGFQNETAWTLVDGTLEKDKLIYSEEYIRLIITILKKVYKIKKFYIFKPLNENKIILNISNKFFCRFINFFYDLPFSYKDERLKTPSIFDYNHRENEYLFWRGLSDTDGSFRGSTMTFSIGMKQKTLLNEFGRFLNKKGISYSQRGQHLNVFVNSLNKYAEVVGSLHPRKQKILLNQLMGGPSHQILVGMNKNNLIKGYFDLSKIPNLRVYIGDLFRKIFKKRSVTQIMKKVTVSRQTVHNWKNNVTAMPFSLFKDFYKGDILNLLSSYNCMFTIGKRGSNKAFLPIRLTDKIDFFASCVRPTMRGLCLNLRSNPNAKQYKEQIEGFFKIQFDYTSSREYRCESSIVNTFFETFFVYDIPWKNYNKENIKELIMVWDIINKEGSVKDRTQKQEGKYYYT